MDCNLLPRGARIIVQSDEYSYSGLIQIPDNLKRRPTTGTITAAGPDADLCDLKSVPDHNKDKTCDGLHIGDRVLYGQFSGTLVQFKGRPTYTILGADEILAKVDVGESLDYTAAG